jgi:hypothetical protein
MAAELPESYRSAVQDAADSWNDATGSKAVLDVQQGNGNQCGVYVRLALPGEIEATDHPRALANSDVESPTCVHTIRVRGSVELADYSVSDLLTHELGHILTGSYDHSADDHSIMAPKLRKLVDGASTWDLWITASDVTAVLRNLRMDSK